MNKVKIAIIDSGIDIKNSYLLKHSKRGKSFILDDDLEEIIEGEDIRDNHGHGTACAYTILRRNENVEILPIKVLDKLGRTNSTCLLKALEFLKETDIKLINISLATVNFSYEEEFFRICNEIMLRDKIIVASMDNRYRDSLPSILSNVIGVRGKNISFTDDYWYNKKNYIQCVCDNEPTLVPGVKEREMRLFGQNSKATAIMTANISKLLSLDINLNFFQVNDLLHEGAIKNNWTSEELKDIKLEDHRVKQKYLDERLKEKTDKLCRLIIETYKSDIDDINLIYKYSLFNNLTKMNKDNFYHFIHAIESKFNIKLDYDKVSLKTFDSIFSLLDLILDSEKG